MSSRTGDALTTGDYLRYAFLLFLGSLVWLVLFGRREGGVASLLAVHLLLATGGLLWFRFHKESP